MRYSLILNELRFVVFECSEVVGSILHVPVHNSRNDRHGARIGKADYRSAARLHTERFPNRHTPQHSSFAAIETRLIEAGEFHILYVHSRVTCACYMYTSKYCTTVVSILYNVFPLLGAKT